MLKIIKIKENSAAQENYLKTSGASILQSWPWREFQEACRRKVESLAVVDDEKILALCQIIKHVLPFDRSYFYCPRGPVIDLKSQISNLKSASLVLNLLIDYLKNLSVKEKAVFLRIEPEILQSHGEILEILKNLGFKKSKREIQPKDTLILDLTKSKGQILKEMHQKTRYNIRLAEKRGVKVRQSLDPKDLEIFYQLLQKTARRDRFSPHPKEHYKKQFAVLGPKNMIRLFLAEYRGKIIAGILVSFYQKRTTYLHGAQDFEFRNLMAPHLLQWSAILEAKKRGCEIYDFWGVSPANAQKNHPWQGINRFKRGFGGRDVSCVGGFDYVFSPFFYGLYNLVHRVKCL